MWTRPDAQRLGNGDHCLVATSLHRLCAVTLGSTDLCSSGHYVCSRDYIVYYSENRFKCPLATSALQNPYSSSYHSCLLMPLLPVLPCDSAVSERQLQMTRPHAVTPKARASKGEPAGFTEQVTRTHQKYLPSMLSISPHEKDELGKNVPFVPLTLKEVHGKRQQSRFNPVCTRHFRASSGANGWLPRDLLFFHHHCLELLK